MENADVRVVSTDGELLAEFTIDPGRNYQTKKQAQLVHDVPRQLSGVSRDTM